MLLPDSGYQESVKWTEVSLDQYQDVEEVVVHVNCMEDQTLDDADTPNVQLHMLYL